MDGRPLVTAICLTQPSREGLVRRAIDNFLAQTYLDKMIFVYTQSAADSLLLVERYRDNPQVLVHATEGWPVRRQLTRAFEQARERGGVVALWDDDDLYHPARLEHQAAALLPDRPSFCCSGIWHYFDTDELFVNCLEKRHENLQERIIPSTMMASASLVGLDEIAGAARYAAFSSPTSAVARAVLARVKDGTRLYDEWWWVVVGVRGDNASGYEWHRKWVTHPTKCRNVAWLHENRAAVEAQLARFPFDEGRRPVVCGRDGVAYDYLPATRWPRGTPPVGDPIGIDVVRETRSEHE